MKFGLTKIFPFPFQILKLIPVSHISRAKLKNFEMSDLQNLCRTTEKKAKIGSRKQKTSTKILGIFHDIHFVPKILST